MIEINGKKLDYSFNAFDPDDIEKLENAEKALQKSTADKIPETTAEYKEWLIHNCRTIQNFFTKLFGDGADREIFGEKTDFIICVDAVIDFYDDMGLQAENVKARFGKFSKNRAERRKG